MGEEKEVRREDQEKINRFSRLHSREKGLDEQLKTKEVWTDIDYLRRMGSNATTEGKGGP